MHKHRWEKSRLLYLETGHGRWLELTFLKFSILHDIWVPIPQRFINICECPGPFSQLKTCVPFMHTTGQETYQKTLNGQYYMNLDLQAELSDLCRPAVQTTTDRHLVYLQINYWICQPTAFIIAQEFYHTGKFKLL